MFETTTWVIIIIILEVIKTSNPWDLIGRNVRNIGKIHSFKSIHLNYPFSSGGVSYNLVDFFVKGLENQKPVPNQLARLSPRDWLASRLQFKVLRFSGSTTACTPVASFEAVEAPKKGIWT